MSGLNSPNPRQSDPASRWLPVAALTVLGFGGIPVVGATFFLDAPVVSKVGPTEARDSAPSDSGSETGGDPASTPASAGVSAAASTGGGGYGFFPEGRSCSDPTVSSWSERRTAPSCAGGHGVIGGVSDGGGAIIRDVADGRAHHPASEEIDNHTRVARRMALDPSALDAVVAGETGRLLAPCRTAGRCRC